MSEKHCCRCCGYLKYFTNPDNFSYEGLPFDWNKYNKAEEIAMECIQHCIDEEADPCYNCNDKHCDNCIYSGRI